MLSLYDIAPIVAILILLCQVVAVLLLWQQMQLQPKTVVVADKRKKIIIGAASLLIAVLGLSGWAISNIENNSSLNVEQETEVKREDGGRFEAFSKQGPGLFCTADKQFSFEINSSYNILSDDSSGVAILTDNGLVTVATEVQDIESKLKELRVDFTLEDDIYTYELPATGSAEADTANFGLSQGKNGFVVSVFYDKGNEESAKQLLLLVIESLEEGCNRNE